MMKLLSVVSICRKYKCTSFVSKAKKMILCSSPNRILYASFYSSPPLFAKQFQEKENEYAHSIMSSIKSYNNSTVKYPLTLKNGPLDSSSTEVSQVQELLDFSKHVIGELYQVDDNMLQFMDDFECNGKYYNRIEVEVQPFIPDDDRVLPIEKPWIYFLTNFREHLLDLPHLENYSSKGPHGLEYVCRYNRPQAEDYYYEVQN